MEFSADKILMRVPESWSCSLGQAPEMLWRVNHLVTDGFCGRVLAMSNPACPIKTGADAMAYQRRILEAAESVENLHRQKSFKPVMTIQITEETFPETLEEACEIGIRQAVVYLSGISNSFKSGVMDITKIYPALGAAQGCDMTVAFYDQPLLDPEGLAQDELFLETLSTIRREFPRLKIVLEHARTAADVNWVINASKESQNVAATITAHDLLEPSTCVHDREALRRAAINSFGNFFYGSRRVVSSFSAVLSNLIEFFSKNNSLPQLEHFISRYGAEFYGYPISHQKLLFTRIPASNGCGPRWEVMQ